MGRKFEGVRCGVNKAGSEKAVVLWEAFCLSQLQALLAIACSDRRSVHTRLNLLSRIGIPALLDTSQLIMHMTGRPCSDVADTDDNGQLGKEAQSHFFLYDKKHTEISK